MTILSQTCDTVDCHHKRRLCPLALRRSRLPFPETQGESFAPPPTQHAAGVKRNAGAFYPMIPGRVSPSSKFL